MAKFVATTSLPQTWNGRKTDYFLGTWCFPHKGMPKKNCALYPWDDRDRMFNDYKKIKKLLSAFEKKIFRILNQVHKKNYHKKYWKIQLYPWLGYFISMIYHNWICIKSLESKGKKYWHTKAVFLSPAQMIPQDSLAFTKMFTDDVWNSHIFGQIMEWRNHKVSWIILKKRKDEQESATAKLNKVNNLIKSIYFYFLDLKNRFFAYENLVYKIYLPKWQQIKWNYIQNKFQIISPLSPPIYGNILFNTKLRKYMTLCLTKNQQKKRNFQSFLNNKIFQYLPFCYLEKFQAVQKAAEKINKLSTPRSITTSVGHIFDEAFKHFIGKNIQKTKLFILPHGGFGTSRFDYDEDHDLSVCTKYFSWGWKFHSKHFILGTLKLSAASCDLVKTGNCFF